MRALRFNFRSLVHAAVPSLRASEGVDGDATAARALASAGLAAVLGLPVLLLFSLALNAPLAVPAAIASGYLVISHALASNRPRRAALFGGIVIVGLLGWLIFYLAVFGEQLSHGGMAAAMMTPLFAAAPALARSVIAPRAEKPAPALVTSLSRAAAQRRVACLDELTPAEAILLANYDGCVLAATRTARRRLRLLPDAFEHHIASVFDPVDMPGVADALRSCKTRGRPIEVAGVAAGEGREPSTLIVAPCEGGGVSLRLSPRPEPQPSETPAQESKAEDDTLGTAAVTPPRRASDVGAAITFAHRQVKRRAEEQGASLEVACDGDLLAVCDPQVGRRVAYLALDAALTAVGAKGAIRVDARRLKGIVLLRVTAERSDEEAETMSTKDPLELPTLKDLVESAGGTLVVDRRESRLMLSVRLDLAGIATTKGRMKDRGEVG